MSDEWLQELKAGDEVYVSAKYGAAPTPAKVIRVTATQIIVDIWQEAKFRRRDGKLIGGGSWGCRYLIQPTGKLKKAVEISRLQGVARRLRDGLAIPTDRATLEALIAALSPFVKP